MVRNRFVPLFKCLAASAILWRKENPSPLSRFDSDKVWLRERLDAAVAWALQLPREWAEESRMERAEAS